LLSWRQLVLWYFISISGGFFSRSFVRSSMGTGFVAHLGFYDSGLRDVLPCYPLVCILVSGSRRDK